MRREHAIHLLDAIELGPSLDLCRDAFPERRGTFLLDGGAFTFFGAEPVASFRAFRTAERTRSGALAARVLVEERGELREARVDDPLAALRDVLCDHAIDPSIYVDRPMPLLAGAIGYIGYETGQMLERLPSEPRARVDLPDIALSIHRWIVGRCRATGRTWLSVIGRGVDESDAHADA